MHANPSSQPPRILFATIAAGGAHVSSAEAMIEALEHFYPGEFQLELREIMPEYGFAALDKQHKESWRWMLAKPWTVNLGERIIGRFPRLTLHAQRRSLRPFARIAAQRLRAQPPALIVANHAWLTIALTMSQRAYGLQVPVLSFQTQTLTSSALWAEPDAERMVLGSPLAKKMLVDFGMPADSIDVVGYPVKRAFVEAPSQAQARQHLGLEPHFTCLIALGGEGAGHDPEAIVTTLRQLAFPLQMVVICGRNKALQTRLETLAASVPELHVRGFVNNMADYIAACDVLIGKTSSATTFETLAVGRPSIATNRPFLSEGRFVDFLLERNLGAFAPDQDALATTVSDYYHHPEKLEQVAKRAQAFNFPHMRQQLAHYLAHYAHTGQPDLSRCGAGIH